MLSFNAPIWQWTPQRLPIVSNNPFLGVFWADVDNRVAGDIYYRNSTDPELMTRATSDIRTYFQHTNFTAGWAFVATWDRVAFYGSSGDKVSFRFLSMILDIHHWPFHVFEHFNLYFLVVNVYIFHQELQRYRDFLLPAKVTTGNAAILVVTFEAV